LAATDLAAAGVSARPRAGSRAFIWEPKPKARKAPDAAKQHFQAAWDILNPDTGREEGRAWEQPMLQITFFSRKEAKAFLSASFSANPVQKRARKANNHASTTQSPL